ncbi:M16 family metallopeptidase [Streptomyces sp. NPDC048392]|uniref:M16 family metallopeptidase n=1 Tax=Streptomyces sp. NPDC048392 TaxID=3365543 RepID=UPI0037239452
MTTTAPPAAHRAVPGTPLRRTLANGLRVVLAPHWPTPRTAVSVHVGVGFRSERPGQEGLAHLFEHLMFRGSESLPRGTFFDALHAQAGTANGTTHQDYTDYVQVVPAAALEQALFREADRLRAPRFTEEQLAAQLTGVGQEIAHMRDGRPFGGCPWPLLPRLLFDNFANTHDGYGGIEQLRRTGVEDCARFFDTHYAPGNTVLTVLGPHSPEEVWPLVERHFGDIPPRPVPAPPALDEPPLTADRYGHWREPGTELTAVAVGHRLPDPATALTDYLAHQVLVEVLGRSAAEGGLPGAARVSASCGFFGPLDTVRPDALVLTALLPPGRTAEGFTAGLTEWWQRHGSPAHVAKGARRAAAALAARHGRAHGDLQERCRALGRLELLQGRPELVDEIPRLLADTAPERVAAAAAGLARTPRAVLLLEPGPRRTRPAPVVPPAGRADGTADPSGPSGAAGPVRSAAALGSSPLGVRPLPPLAEQPEAVLDRARETRLPGGLRLIAVRDRRSALVELRLRVSLGAEGWREPRRVARLLGTADLTVRATARAALLGGGLRLSTDGQWADLAAWCPVSERTALLRILAELLDPARLPDGLRSAGERLLEQSPERRMDEVLRRHWAPVRAPGGGLPDPAELHRRVLGPHGAVLVSVGDVDPERTAAEVAEALSGWTGRGAPAAAGAGGAGGPAGVLAVDVPDAPGLPAGTGDFVHVTLSGEEPGVGAHDPARYLVTALFGGHPGSRLSAWCRRGGHTDHHLSAGRDRLADRPRALVRLTVPRHSLAPAVAGVTDEVRRLAAVPVPAAEVEEARRYCATQLLSAFDSPGLLADALRYTFAAGRDLDWVIRRPRLLGAVGPEAVSAAAGALYGSLTESAVVLGRIDRREAVRELERAGVRRGTPA